MKVIERIREYSFFLKKNFSTDDYQFLTSVINKPYIRRICYSYRSCFVCLLECTGKLLCHCFFLLFVVFALIFCPVIQLFYSYLIRKVQRQEKQRKQYKKESVT